jgi:hypothetical protein
MEYVRMPPVARARRTIDPLHVAAIVVGATILAVYLVTIVLQAVLVRIVDGVNVLGVAFLYGIAASVVGCALLAIGAGARPRSTGEVVLAGTIGALAGLAPICLVVFLRLSIRTCVVLNTLGLPWPEPWREIAHWGAGLVWLASTVLLIVAVARPALQPVGVAMWVWSGVISIPASIFFFFTLYGDPLPGCVPV